MITLNLNLPTCWQELTQTQMRYVFFLMKQNYTADEVKTFCLCRFGGLKVLERTDTGYRVLYENNPHDITAVQIAEQLPRLAWLDELPLVPLRLAQIGKHSAVAADLSGVPFADYLACDNLYIGYLQTQQDDALWRYQAGEGTSLPEPRCQHHHRDHREQLQLRAYATRCQLQRMGSSQEHLRGQRDQGGHGRLLAR